jgi:hypothetical protein
MRHDFVTLPRHEIVAIGVRVSSRTQGAPKPRPLLRAHDLPWNEGSSDRHERISDHLGVFRAAFCAVPTALCTALKHPAIGPTSPHQAPPFPSPWPTPPAHPHPPTTPPPHPPHPANSPTRHQHPLASPTACVVLVWYGGFFFVHLPGNTRTCF